MSTRGKVVLAYSGGLDTSVAVKWIQETYGLDVVALTIDMGAQEGLEEARQRALDVGAIAAEVVDAREAFVKYFCWPSLQAGAVYEDAYPLATALGRPLIAKLLVDTARRHGAEAVAHGCTGKGNDQVRFDVGIKTLAPQMRVIAPARECYMTREEAIDYAKKHGINVGVTKKSPYSTDENLWGRSIECGVLEDSWEEPPEDAYLWITAPHLAPEEPQYVEIEFENGIPIALDNEEMGGPELIAALNETAGRHGVGRIDLVENRLVGIKSREIYESPAAVVLHAAHKALESICLTRQSQRFKSLVATQFADNVYDGLWFSGFHRDLSAYVLSSQRAVNGTVRMKLYRGSAVKVGVKSPDSLYNKSLATYDEGDEFDHRAALGFIELHGLPMRTQSRFQRHSLESQELKVQILPPEIGGDTD